MDNVDELITKELIIAAIVFIFGLIVGVTFVLCMIHLFYKVFATGERTGKYSESSFVQHFTNFKFSQRV